MVKVPQIYFNKKQLHIMDVAMKLFSENGFNATSVRDIAKEANVNLAMINYYFGSKNNLLVSIFQYMGEVSRKYLDSVFINERYTVLERFEYVIQNYIRFAIDHRHFMVIMMRQQFNDTIPEVQEMIFQLKERYWRIFYISLEEAKRLGAFKDTADVNTIAGIVVGTVNFLLFDRMFLSRFHQLPPDHTMDEYNELIINKYMVEVKKVIDQYVLK